MAEEALTVIRIAAKESGLAERPARQAEDLMVGGGSTSGVVYLGGAQIVLLSQPAEADVERVRKVKTAIAAAIPPRFDRFTDPD